MKPQNKMGGEEFSRPPTARTTKHTRTQRRSSKAFKFSRDLRGWNLIVRNHRDWLEVEPNRTLLRKLLDLILEDWTR